MIQKILLLVGLLALSSLCQAERQFSHGDAEKFMHPHIRKTGRRFQTNLEEQDIEFWNREAQQTLRNKWQARLNTNVAKNVIMFLGDGMSISTLKAARLYLGQSRGEDGERTKLAMEYFPYSGLSKNYCLDALVADSACSATAYLCGVKANSFTLGVGGRVAQDDCQANLDKSNYVYSIAKWSQDVGKRTGVVTTTTVTHASPAGAYAHTANRMWESDADTTDPACEDIALQLVHGETGKNLNVVFGGGRSNFLPNTTVDEEGFNGRRKDGRNLIREWLNSKRTERAEYVWNRSGLFRSVRRNDNILGLFEDTNMQYYLDAKDNPEEPTLPEMTEAAINVLSKGKNGYFLFVEGGKIDHGHHANQVHYALSETVQLSEAIQRARNMTNEEDTLIVVTSDHGHVFTVAGFPERGTNVLTMAGLGSDGIPFPILSYANGPGYRKEVNGVRYDFSKSDFNDIKLEYPTTAPAAYESHSGDEVGIFASGPWAHLFSGVLEQNVIPHAMAFASCVGEGATACNKKH